MKQHVSPLVTNTPGQFAFTDEDKNNALMKQHRSALRPSQPVPALSLSSATQLHPLVTSLPPVTHECVESILQALPPKVSCGSSPVNSIILRKCRSVLELAPLSRLTEKFVHKTIIL
eukprot:GHVN01072527.1.p1 GENE.GHVN01072527.1~~GHVN01072527.1.p1  ORF type:complete len:127 (+),score=18.35 GHVN01072527.1:32-382(+)